MATRNIVPRATGEGSIGTAAKHWGAGRFDSLPNWQEYLAESTGYGVVSGCEPTISGLTVTVASGVVHLSDGTRKEIASTNITLDSADPSNPRIDLVYIDSTGEVAKITGTAAASPSAPTLPTGGISVANVTIVAGASTGTVNRVQTIAPNLANYGIVNVKDFGAVGDGLHDDTAAIQAAIDYAESNNNCNPVIIIPRICKVTSLYISNHGDDWYNRKQIIFCGGGGFLSESDYLFKRKTGITHYVGNLAFRDIIFKSVAGNGFTVMPGYPFLRCRWINCTFRAVDSIIKADDFVQTMYFIHCTAINGDGYLIDMSNGGADINIENCLIERRANGVIKQQSDGMTLGGINIVDSCIESINGNAIVDILHGAVSIRGCYFEATPYIVKITHVNKDRMIDLEFDHNWQGGSMVTGTPALTYFTCDTGIVLYPKQSNLAFKNNLTSVPLINIGDINVGYNAAELARPFIKFSGNTTRENLPTNYTRGSDDIIKTSNFVEFTGNFPFVYTNDAIQTLMTTDDMYIGTFHGVRFYFQGGELKTTQVVSVSLNANEEKVIDVALTTKSPMGIIINNYIDGTQVLNCYSSGLTAKITMKNPTGTAKSGDIRLYCNARIPTFG